METKKCIQLILLGVAITSIPCIGIIINKQYNPNYLAPFILISLICYVIGIIGIIKNKRKVKKVNSPSSI